MKPSIAPKTGKPTPITGKAGTVTVYKTGTAFTLAWMAGGERKREKRKDWTNAQARAKEILADLGTGAAHIRSFTAKESAVVDSCVEMLAGIKMPLAQAVREYVEAINILNGRCSVVEAAKLAVAKMGETELPSITVQKLVAEFLAAKRREMVSERYHDSIRLLLGRFAQAHYCTVTSLKTADLQRWMDAQKGSTRTKKNIATGIRTFFEYARKIGYLPRTQSTEAEHISIGRVREAAPGIYSPETLKAVLDASTGLERLAVALAAFTGMRSAELHRLEWHEINGDHIEVAPEKAKTASRRIVPILPALRAVLSEYERGSGRVFAHNKMETHFSRFFARAFRSAGEKPVPNGFRHSYASYRLAIVESADKVSLEMGNSPRKLFTNYRELVTRVQAQEWFAVTLPQAENITQMEAVA
jgi:integrase